MREGPSKSLAGCVQYQPVHALHAHRRVVGCEALLRPDSQSLISGTPDLTAHVLERAHLDELSVELLSVNLEPSHVEEPSVVDALRTGAGRTNGLVVEVTERGDIPSSAALRTLKATGARVALDDVSPARFQSAVAAQPDIVKLELHQWRRHLRRAIGVCRANGIEVVVERIESRADAEWARRAGATLGQGFYWSPPLSAARFHSYVRHDRLSA